MKKIAGLFLMLMMSLILTGQVRAVDASSSKSDQEIIETLKKTYPLDTCFITGDKLGAMGPTIDYLYKYKVGDKEEVRLVRLCCGGCLRTFKGDPEKYIQKLDEAVKAKVASTK